MHAPHTHLTPRRTICFWLNCLVIACILPAVIVTTFIILRSFTQERAGIERDLAGRARALDQAVDAELKGTRSALLVLAMSPHLASGDLAKFYGDARKLVEALATSTMSSASDLDGQQLINTLLPYGASLPRLYGGREQLQRVIETRQPIISDLFIGAVTGKPIIIIEASVMLDGNPRYFLAVGMFPERLSAILRQQKMPSDWVAVIVDNSETIVARTVGGEEFVGKKVSPDLMRALRSAAEGSFEGVTLEGVSVLTGFSRSTVSGWSVAIGVPKAGLFAFLRQALFGNVVAAILLLVGGTFLAKLISARIADSIRALRDPAIELGTPGPLVVPPAAIQEVDELGRSLVAAHGLVQHRTAERDDLRRRIMSAQEEERLRLAHDLHDQTGQGVTAAILELKAIEPLVHKKGLDRVRFLRKQLDELSQMLHRIAWELRPPSIDELGLTNALENYVADWGKSTGSMRISIAPIPSWTGGPTKSARRSIA